MNPHPDIPARPAGPTTEDAGREIASRPTRTALEFDSYLALVALEARTDFGRRRLLELLPAASEAELLARRRAYAECDRLRLEAPLVPSLGDGLASLVERAASGEPVLAGPEILTVARFVRAAMDAARRIVEAPVPCPELAAEAAALPDARELLSEIDRILDRKGEVRDDASPRLGTLRREVQNAREKIYGRLEGIRGEHRELLGEETVPLRGGRLMLMLSSGARGRIPGLVHGRSATGKSLYFEPIAVVEENNNLQNAFEELEAERARLLLQLVAALTAAGPLLAGAAALVGRLDALEAAARLAAECGARLAETPPPGRLRLVGARHPLLDPRLARRRERALGSRGHEGPVEPLSITLGGGAGEEEPAAQEERRRVLVVTGPNAGGKTVALKTVGLLTLVSGSGLPVPVEAGSEIPWFENVVATVGDEQDLLAERSTFSGRLARLAEAWSAAGARSLALLDELGSGTDPEEGSALSVALLEQLVAHRGLALITTHLTGVAAAAMELPGAFCAAMEFDPGTGRPTFRLRPGSPGGSEALALARRMGLPAAWIARAETILGAEHRDLRQLLAELEATRSELAVEAARERAATEEANRLGERLATERAELEAERRTVAERMKRSSRRSARRSPASSRRRSNAPGGARGRSAPRAGREAAGRLFADAPSLGIEAPSAPREELVEGVAVRHRRSAGAASWRRSPANAPRSRWAGSVCEPW
ncbi:MAG: hypothetical protein R2862_03960 [Thermoanaerobaculia bacterium]